jgi:hypothetical protein
MTEFSFTVINSTLKKLANNSISLKPLSVLNNQNVTVVIDFSFSTLKVHEKISSNQYSLHCRNDSTYWSAKVINSTRMECLIPFTSSNYLSLDVVMKFAQYSANDIFLSKKPVSFYYVNNGSIQFTESLPQVYSKNTDFLTVNLTTSFVIPNEISKFVECRLSINSSFIVSTRPMNNLTNVFECKFLISVSGKQDISLWFNDGYKSFKLSTNTLEIVIASIEIHF